MNAVAIAAPRSPLEAGPALDARAFREVRRRAMFECFKWDPQVEDVSVLTSFPLVLQRDAYDELARVAEAAAHELAAAERELLARPELVAQLGLPRRTRRLFAPDASPGVARVYRFDFHPTASGFRLSEVNSDVPGGYVETSGFARLVAEHHAFLEVPADPARALARALRERLGAGARVALVHATAFVDDRQVMLFLERAFHEEGLLPVLASPDDVAFDAHGGAVRGARVDGLFRFFPAEWLPNLGWRQPWRRFFRGATLAASNPASALLVQSKRLAAIAHRLETPMPTFLAHLPETRAANAVPFDSKSREWIWKPALGRVGDGVVVAGASRAVDFALAAMAIGRRPDEWIAQRRFDSLPIDTPDGPVHACIGLWVIDGRAAGAYGRLASRAVIDHRARDVAVLVPRTSAAEGAAA